MEVQSLLRSLFQTIDSSGTGHIEARDLMVRANVCFSHDLRGFLPRSGVRTASDAGFGAEVGVGTPTR
jgi:hypothetical protein